MKTRLSHFMIIGLVCGLTLTLTNLLAQTTARVPIGRPTSAYGHAPLFPSGPTPLLPSKAPTGGGLAIGQSYDGIHFLGSNCNCLPPDTNAAVGDNYVVEAVNVQLRVFDKTSCAFGAPPSMKIGFSWLA